MDHAGIDLLDLARNIGKQEPGFGHIMGKGRTRDLCPEHRGQIFVVVFHEIDDLEACRMGFIPVPDQIFEGGQIPPGFLGIDPETDHLHMGQGLHLDHLGHGGVEVGFRALPELGHGALHPRFRGHHEGQIDSHSLKGRFFFEGKTDLVLKPESGSNIERQHQNDDEHGFRDELSHGSLPVMKDFGPEARQSFLGKGKTAALCSIFWERGLIRKQ